jgi:hypothetical protein
MESLVLRNSWLSRLNWPGRVGIIHVRDMALFIYNVSLYKPNPKSNELYIPAVEAPTLQDMFKIIYEALNKDYKSIIIPEFIWQVISFAARNKRVFEVLLPHKLYNRMWQGFLVVNSEFYNLGLRIKEVLGEKSPKLFKEYYLEKFSRVVK